MRRRCNFFLWLATITALVALSTTAPARAGDVAACTAQMRPGDEIWLVSCRGLECGAVESQASRLQYWHYDRQRSWVRSSLDNLVATDSSQSVTVVFVHGNRISWDEAFTKGWSAYLAVARGADARPLRFIIWSWPSEAIRGPIVDARTKAWRTNPCGYYLAWLVDRFQPNVPVSLWGHSFGARVVTGSLHLLGGGSIDQYRLTQRAHATRDPMDAVLLAAALDNDWLAGGHYHGQAMSQVSRLLLINNSCDALLRRYHLLYGRRCCQQALGYTGIANWGLAPADWSKITQVDACCDVGRDHWFHLYIGSPGLVERMRRFLFWRQTPPVPAAPQEARSASHQDLATMLRLLP